MRRQSNLLRDFEAGPLLDLLFVAAVTTVLVVRFVLAVTGYPRLGGSGLHIAHMLWGGLLMLAAVVALLSFLDRPLRRLAALAGGIGFGLFIDEVGKILTHDSDYFYRPSVAIIYVVFVLLYLIIRSLHRDVAARPEEYLANALAEMLQIVQGDLDGRERERALGYLRASGADDPLTRALHQALQGAETRPGRPPSHLTRWALAFAAHYRAMALSRRFGQVLVVFFAAQLLLRLGRLIEVIGLIPAGAPLWRHVSFLGEQRSVPAAEGFVLWLQFGSSLLSGLFLAFGLALVFRDRLRALRMFQRAVLTALVLTQVFVFYRTEWLGLGELLLNLLIFFALRYAIDREKRWRAL